MIREKITKLTPEQFRNCAYVEYVDTIYDEKYGDGRKTPYVITHKITFKDGKVLQDGKELFLTRSLNGATKKVNDDIQYYGNKNGGMPHFSSEFYIVYNDPQSQKGFKTATYGRKEQRNSISQLENSVRNMF